MSKEWKGTSCYTLTSQEVERLLKDNFGDKIQPVDGAKMARQRRNQAHRYEKQAEMQNSAKIQSSDNLDDPGI